MSEIKAVMFDYDGTLMDTNNIIVESWQHTFRTLKKMEYPVEQLYATFGEPLSETMENFFPGEDQEKCLNIYRSYQEDCYEKLIELFPGMKGLIRNLKERGYLVAIVTSRLPASTLVGVEKYGIADYFDAIVTCADTEKHKPDPDPVLTCARKLGIAPSEAVMVGDTSFDLICGRRAGAKTVLVSWSAACGNRGDRKDCGDAGRGLSGEAIPDFIAQRAEDILTYVETQ